MKKILGFILILILVLSGCAPVSQSQENPGQSSVYSEGDSADSTSNPDAQHSEALGTISVYKGGLDLIREMIHLDEEQFMEFMVGNMMEHLQEGKWSDVSVVIGGRDITRQDFVDFLEIFETMVVPILPDASLNMIEYSPDRFYRRFYVNYTTKDGEQYHFSVPLSSAKTNVEKAVENYTKESPEMLYQKKDEQVKVYANPRYSGLTAIWFCLDIDGQFVQASYRNENVKSHLELKAEDIYKDLTVGLLKDISW